MSKKDKFSLLRKALKLLGLSDERAAEIIDRIQEWLMEDKVVEQTPVLYPYHLRDFLSPAELNFYRILQTVVVDWAIVCPKVNLNDIFFTQTGDPGQNRSYRNRINRKHVDFLLCDPQTVKPILGVELDDKSHQRANRRKRDEFVDAVFSAAELPLIHIPVQRSYDTELVARELRQRAGFATQQVDTPTLRSESLEEIDADTPNCPKCGAKMVLRTAKSGPNVGNMFFGCSRYPKCRGIVPYDN